MKLRKLARAPRRASAAVELAILLPVVLMPILLGIWELGRIVEVQQILDNAAREGARQASTGQKTNAQVSQIVLQYLTDAGLNNAGSNVVVTDVTSPVDVSAATRLDHITVTVSLPYTNIRWTTLSLFANSSTNLNASADWYSMRDIPLSISSTIPTTLQ
jgi:Flp pilus assembly protein TadG